MDHCTIITPLIYSNQTQFYIYIQSQAYYKGNMYKKTSFIYFFSRFKGVNLWSEMSDEEKKL